MTRIPNSRSEATTSFKNGLNHLGESITRKVESFKDMGSGLHGRMANREAPVYSRGVRELDDYGYERFNLDDGDDTEIFFSRLSDKALFNDGDPIIVRGTEGNYVGSADPFAESEFEPRESMPAPEDARSLFKNVPMGTAASNTYVGTVGINNGGQIEPVSNDFLKKMTRVTNTRAPPVVEEAEGTEAPVEPVASAEPVAEQPVEAPAEEHRIPDFMSRIKTVARHEAPAEEVPEDEGGHIEAQEADAEVGPVVEEPVAEQPAPELNVDVFKGMPASKPKEEFFIPTDEEEAPEVLDCDSNVEVEDYDWYFEDEAEEPVEGLSTPPIMEVPEEVVEEAVTEFVAMDEAVEAPEEVQIGEVAEVAPEVEEVAEVTEETPAEVPAEIPVEAPEEVPIEAVASVEDVPEVTEETVAAPEVCIEEIIEQEVAQAVASEVALEAVVEGILASEPVREVIAGLHVEGNEPQSDVVSNSVVSAVSVPQMAATAASAVVSAEARAVPEEVRPEPARVGVGIQADGEALPPMSDPVITRPRPNRSARFKFNNGVLVSVDSEKKESKEGLQSPLE